jgi:hypothetical protein
MLESASTDWWRVEIRPAVLVFFQGVRREMQGTQMDEKLRCVSCGDVIGTYEPLVTLCAGQTRRTSKAAEMDRCDSLGECYHRACFENKHGEPGE